MPLCNVVSKFFQRQALTLYQHCAVWKIRRRILFHFQRWINFISTLIGNVATTLIRLRNVGWANSGGDRKMICTICKSQEEKLKLMPCTNLTFIDGCANFKSSTWSDHVTTDEHNNQWRRKIMKILSLLVARYVPKRQFIKCRRIQR